MRGDCFPFYHDESPLNQHFRTISGDEDVKMLTSIFLYSSMSSEKTLVV